MLIPCLPQARSMKPNAYKDVMTERWVAGICAYPACDNGPRKPYNAEQPMVSLYHIDSKVQVHVPCLDQPNVEE